MYCEPLDLCGFKMDDGHHHMYMYDQVLTYIGPNGEKWLKHLWN